MRTMLALLGTSQTSALHRVHNNLIGAVLASRRNRIYRCWFVGKPVTAGSIAK